MLSSSRIAIVVSHPIQYYVPWFRHLTAAGFKLRVFYLWDFGVTAQRDPEFGTTFVWDIDLLSGYEHESVPNVARNPGTDSFFGLHNPQLTARIGEWQPDTILIFGYKYRTHLTLVAWARRKQIPLIFRGDSHLLGRPRLSCWKRWPLWFLYSQFDAFLCVGQANRAYFQSIGVPADKLFFAPHCVEANRFRATADHQAAAQALRVSLGLGERRIVLFAGKLVPAKQPKELLEAFVAADVENSALIYVGDGSESASLQKAAASSNKCIHFLPFANQSEMPSRYLLADVFVLPSRGWHETWGLAVNEAMHMGVPCLVSDRVGCQQDLVIDGETGWVASNENPTALTTKLKEALKEVGLNREHWRNAAQMHVSGYSYAMATQGLNDALAHIGK